MAFLEYSFGRRSVHTHGLPELQGKDTPKAVAAWHFDWTRRVCLTRATFPPPTPPQAHLSADHGVTDHLATVGFSVRRTARDGSGLGDSRVPGGGDERGQGFGESRAEPEPEPDLAGGFVVPVPSNRRQRRATGLSAGAHPFEPAGSGSGVGGSGGGGGNVGVAGEAARRGEEMFPSLPMAPRPSTGERHSLSLVGRPGSLHASAGGVASARASARASALASERPREERSREQVTLVVAAGLV